MSCDCAIRALTKEEIKERLLEADRLYRKIFKETGLDHDEIAAIIYAEIGIEL